MEPVNRFTRLSLSVVLFLMLSLRVYTQTDNTAPVVTAPGYTTAMGIRAGYTSGLTIKRFTSATQAFEGILSLGRNKTGITLLYEKHAASPTVPGFKWYYGAGAHFSHYNRSEYSRGEGPNYRYYYYRVRPDGNGIGIDGILGIEYKIAPIPFAISLDLKPYVEMHTSNSIYMALDPGLGIKFTF
jgi:hypothetical protein